MNKVKKQSENTEDGLQSKKFRHQLICIVVGALIGFVPTSFVTVYQARQQREQALLFHRLDALRDFSVAVSASGELISSVSELEVAIHRLERLGANSSPEDWKRVDTLYKDLIDRRYKWISQVTTQGTVIEALFGTDVNGEPQKESDAGGGVLLNFSDAASAKRPTAGDSPDETIAYMKTNVAAFKKQLAATIDITQRTINLHAARLLKK